MSESFRPASGRILSKEEYVRHPFAQSEKSSYVYDLEAGGKSLRYIGAEHTNHPDHPLFAEIVQAFEPAPDLVLVEGQPGLTPDRLAARMEGITEDEAEARGESFYTAWLAYSRNIPVESPEPPFPLELEHLRESGFSVEEIVSYYLSRTVAQYLRNAPEPTVEGCKEYVQPFLVQVERGMEDAAELVHSTAEHLVEDLSLDDPGAFARAADPIPWEGRPYLRVNQVAAASSAFRDRYVVDRIADALTKHDRILVVFGSAHAVTQEPALRALMEQLPQA